MQTFWGRAKHLWRFVVVFGDAEHDFSSGVPRVVDLENYSVHHFPTFSPKTENQKWKSGKVEKWKRYNFFYYKTDQRRAPNQSIDRKRTDLTPEFYKHQLERSLDIQFELSQD